MNLFDQHKPKVLIVDDSEINREILSEILGDDYDIIEAVNGAEAIDVLRKNSVNISLVLLDINMPVMDGYQVLEIMNEKHWIDDVPVIMISADDSVESMHRAYELGITDFINRSFDALIVRRRVINTIMLYSKQKKLIGMVADQIYEKEKSSNLMINVLSHIVEFRNGESGMHVLHVQLFTQILLKQLVQITDKYNLTDADISLISKASALHDIGKISIPDEILNKPGRLTDEEFAIMKRHSLEGAAMLDELVAYKDEPLVKVAYQICRWHHERYDGRGYPDGLKGEEIPISAQIVALADVYDALTSERVYKKAFSHEKAVNMILNNECGVFNPLLMECLTQAAETIRSELNAQDSTADGQKEMENISLEMLKYDELSSSEETLRLLEYERMKNSFYESVSDEMFFEYTSAPPMVTLSPNCQKLLGFAGLVNNPAGNDEIMSLMNADDRNKLAEKIRSVSKENPAVELNCRMSFLDGVHEAVIVCRPAWDTQSEYYGVFGKIIDNGLVKGGNKIDTERMLYCS
ncbi:MAG: response regulator [Ruminococcus flavefaciens]|nr:response regulator [Ruminococcus flavefaciens]MCM1229572.1 response regulator [Ruminococcus flavefaciens]